MIAGASMIETIIVFPIMMFVGMAIVHLALVYQAKSNLEYTALMVARVAAAKGFSTQAAIDDMVVEARYRMGGTDRLDVPSSDYAAILADAAYDTPLDKVRFRIVRPNSVTFADWGGGGAGCGGSLPCVIPSNNLLYRDPTELKNGISIQDANILTIEVQYFVETGVPFMSLLMIGETKPADDRDLDFHESNRFNKKFRGSPGLWVKAQSTVIMQTDAVANALSCKIIDGYSC